MTKPVPTPTPTPTPSVYLNKITFFNGQELTLNSQDTLLIVGPNNSGKSQTLRDITSIISNGPANKSVVESIELIKIGSLDQFRKHMEKESSLLENYYYHGQTKLHSSWVRQWEYKNRLDELTGIFLKNITAKERLNICEQQNSIAPGEQKTKPQHLLYDNSDLMNEVSELFKKAFNKSLSFDYRGGSKLPIHVIDNCVLDDIKDRVSNDYINKLREFPLLNQQGDGVKSYAGILFETIAFKYNISLIDEPEAFLHPPQMRKLGQTLAENVKGQLIIATHSSDIMRGFLEGTKGNLRIIRIQRDNVANKIHEVNQEAIKELWSKPNLKYSNALDSIFHEQVIICEDDSDCRVINFVADYISENESVILPDTSFVPSGGKHAIAGIAKILRLSGVPVKAIYDFDLISERNTLATALDAFGADKKEEILSLWTQINSEVTQKNKSLSNEEIKKLLIETISTCDADLISKTKIEDIFKQKKPWNEVKLHGINGLPKGNIRNTFKIFNKCLKEIGIYLIPVGEIENFSPETGSHGPKFVTSFLSTRNLADSELTPLRDFVKDVYTSKIT
ncbi:hypothetical protein C5Y41_18055 [Rahnella variigena]|uniref:ATP-dependent nuclease n=1 Tax=Rahnella variigena TaxID=574964 RepID=UPI00101DA698|nr:AAA family ATPase [Rahnella variigena]RYJ19009.1 hypothetical protein C5Y41_18055 [Rahnella variigena]